MATESQLAALRNWIKQEIPVGEAVCEMPAEICSDALSRLHDASEAYKEDKKKNYGIVGKTKKEIVRELREQRWIDVQTGVNNALGAEKKAASMQPAPPNREEAEAQKVSEEQGKATPAQPAAKPTVAELITKYRDILAEITIAVNTDDRIPDREKGYATKFLYDSVTAEMERIGGSQEEA